MSRSSLAPSDLAALVEMLSHEAIANRADGFEVLRAFKWLRDVVETGDQLMAIPKDGLMGISLIAVYVEAVAHQLAVEDEQDAELLRRAATRIRQHATRVAREIKESPNGQTPT